MSDKERYVFDTNVIDTLGSRAAIRPAQLRDDHVLRAGDIGLTSQYGHSAPPAETLLIVGIFAE